MPPDNLAYQQSLTGLIDQAIVALPAAQQWLFACRTLGRNLAARHSPVSWAAIEVLERYAVGQASWEEMRTVSWPFGHWAVFAAQCSAYFALPGVSDSARAQERHTQLADLLERLARV